MTQSARRKPLSEKVKSSLRKKAEGTKFFYSELAEVYRKGQGAYLSAGSRNVPMGAWAMGRVNSYMTGKGGARTADAKIYTRYNKRR
jgi:hypothetical protein